MKQPLYIPKFPIITGLTILAFISGQYSFLLGNAIAPKTRATSGLRFREENKNEIKNETPFSLFPADEHTASPAAMPNVDPVINIWYGSHQVFGHLGIPQQWVNILGNVTDSDSIAALTYSLNNGPALPLSLGPNRTRLVAAGDFNVEIAYTDLLEGPNEIVITAADKLGNTSVANVTVEHKRGNVWPESYAINWDSVSNISEVAQIVDGLWTLEANSVRTFMPGYDRLIAIGDVSWDDYEVSVPITIHRFLTSGALVGILMRWRGHFPWGDHQPRIGWWPVGALGIYRPENSGNDNGALEILGDRGVTLAQKLDRRLELGVRYIFKMRVQTLAGQGGSYRLKVWRDGEPEPSRWDVTAQGGESDVQNGSFLLVAHHTDASFGDVTVAPLIDAIKNIQVERGTTLATITWHTDKPATSSVAYGQSEAYEDGGVDDNTLVTDHAVTLNGLIPGQRYHYQITSVDEAGTVASSTDLTFRTLTPSTIISDEFNSFDLNARRWKFIDPHGDAKLTMTAKQLSITVPAGTAHDVWTTGNHAPRIMQPANDTDFEVEVKFDSQVSEWAQLQGILIEENSDNFLRFDFYHDGSRTRIFAASLANGSSTVKNNSTIAGGAPLYMRVKRVGDLWKQSYSYNGENWVTSASFTHVLSINSVGAFAGNAGSHAPIHTGIIDYFFNTASPILDKVAPVISNLEVTPGDTSAIITWTTNEPAFINVAYGPSERYENGSINDSTLATEHTINLTGLAAGTRHHYQITAVDSSGNATRSPDLTFSTNRGPITKIEALEGKPTRFELHQNYPNPTRVSSHDPTTTIAFSLPMPGYVTLNVFTITGEEAAVLVAEHLAARRYQIKWNATGFPTGVYFYRLSAKTLGENEPFSETKKLLILK